MKSFYMIRDHSVVNYYLITYVYLSVKCDFNYFQFLKYYHKIYDILRHVLLIVKYYMSTYI